MCGSDSASPFGVLSHIHSAVFRWQYALCFPRRSGFDICKKFHHREEDRRFAPILFSVVEVMGIEPMSENPLTQLSSWAVCFLFFPFGDASRHAFPHGSTFFPDRFRRDRRCRFTAHLTLSPKPRYSWEERVTRRSRHCLNFTLSRKTQAAIATVLLSFIICFGQFSSLPGSPRLSCLRIPVETFTPPCFHSLTGSPDPIPLYTLFSALSREKRGKIVSDSFRNAKVGLCAVGCQRLQFLRRAFHTD